ncbi:MAG: hypothetical protein CMQ51_05575 [Gammaproteobacteria bacterium]|nr:hypothetical protein [Gammaproteobacteria bacterium]|tara:strand:+ start:213 stop:1901 length:1689 start_codon:yes stop_codon:yes gene_type:complete
MSIVQKLTEGIVSRDLGKEGAALLTKWERTGLLEGLDVDRDRQTMARLLENQAKELLREASTMAGGDVEGFAAVAFPIVRRVFGSLIANELVSVQPMSLPSGLIFFLDFQHTNARLDYAAADSIYGGGVVGQQITGGVSLVSSSAEGSFYNLNQGYTSPTGSTDLTFADGGDGVYIVGNAASTDKNHRFDPDLESGSYAQKLTVTLSEAQEAEMGLSNGGNVMALSGAFGTGVHLLRRLSAYNASTRQLSMVIWKSSTFSDANGSIATAHPIADDFTGTAAAGSTNALGAVVGDSEWGLENQETIPEIDIKVDSVSVTAVTKKLKAKWTPELGQDLNAYHNLDAEVELTSILSEQIALEIDREILGDLVTGATAGTYYWSRSPGLFVTRDTGAEIGASSAAPDFTGTVSEWYETLVETINDVSAQIHRKTLRGGANFLVCGPEVANILEFTSGFRAKVSHDDAKGQVGAVNVGSLSKKWDVIVDPYFPRNVVLVGRRGNSFLESGYVYSPYVPLQVTPTIFGVEDFVPRKGVMTRYAKKMVRPDMYGIVVVRGLLGEAGATS